MMQELEEAIRVIVRDELRKALATEGMGYSTRRGAFRKNLMGVPLMIGQLLMERGPLSTPAIANALWTEELGPDKGTFKTSVRNHVWSMHKRGELTRETRDGEWMYSVAPAP